MNKLITLLLTLATLFMFFLIYKDYGTLPLIAVVFFILGNGTGMLVVLVSVVIHKRFENKKQENFPVSQQYPPPIHVPTQQTGGLYQGTHVPNPEQNIEGRSW